MKVFIITIQPKYGSFWCNRWIDSIWVNAEHANKRLVDIKAEFARCGTAENAAWVSELTIQDAKLQEVA